MPASRSARADAKATRQAARHRHLHLSRGLRHRAVGGGRLARRPRRPLRVGRGPRPSDRLGDRLHRHRTATARATRRPSPSSSPTRSACRSRTSRSSHGDTDKIPFGMGTYGSRSLAVGGSAMVKAMDKIVAKAKKHRRPPDGGIGRRHRVQGRQLHGRRHRQDRSRSARSRSPPMCRTTTRSPSSSPASTRRPSTTRRTSPSRAAATSARSRSTPRPASPRSSASPPSDDVGESSTR